MNPGDRLRKIVNWKPRPRFFVRADEIREGDYIDGEQVVSVEVGEVYTVYYTRGKPYPDAWHNHYAIMIERDER